MDIALAAATEENEPVKGLKPILIELGGSEDVEIVRRASWTLAYCYRHLHPNGEKHGFVQRHCMNPDYDLFLLLSDNQQPGIPYAVVLYPVPPRRHWSKEEAETIVDQVFPPAARGEASPDTLTEWSSRWYQRGYVTFSTGKRRSAGRILRVTIGYRSNVYWHPLHSCVAARTLER